MFSIKKYMISLSHLSQSIYSDNHNNYKFDCQSLITYNNRINCLQKTYKYIYSYKFHLDVIPQKANPLY